MPCGDFLVQAARDTGLPAWTEADRSIEKHRRGALVRSACIASPGRRTGVMPAGVVSFWLKQHAFSGRDPSHDVPPSHQR